MARLSNAVLAELAGMDDYDRTLALDRIARQHDMTPEQVMAEVRAFQQGGDVETTSMAALDERISPTQTDSQSHSGKQPDYLTNAHRYRVRYDPSHDGQNRQSQVEQAILCPHCSAPLGIPAIRPIKVTCPNCMNEAVFNS